MNHDAEFLVQQLDQNINTLISDIKYLPLPDKNLSATKDDIAGILKRRKELFHLNYFSADGNLIYSSTKASLEWQSNLLNSDWYRKLIREWNITVTDIYKSPVSPFPKVIAIAIPVSVNKRISGFWLAYLDILHLENFFPAINDSPKNTTTIWFDGNGEIISQVSGDKTITNTFIKSNGWWYRINESKTAEEVINNILTTQKETKKYVYGTQHSEFENLQVLALKDLEIAYGLFYSFKTNIIILAIFLQLFIMIVTAVIIWQWQKQKEQLTELVNVNNLLETKSTALTETGKKQDKLVEELADQKNQLLKATNDLERVQKYLNFLTLPVIALDDKFTYEFVNRAAEIEFNYSFEKLKKKPFEQFLLIEKKSDFDNILGKAKKDLQRQESGISIKVKDSIKNFMVACDYLILSDWQGYIITFSDLTEFLQLQNNIKTQNVFLENTSAITELFLQPESEFEILKKALMILGEYTGCSGIYLYQLENDKLACKTSIQNKKQNIPDELPFESIAGSTVLSGKAVIINDIADLPVNISSVEKEWNFQCAVFQPLIINNNITGVIIVTDPQRRIIEDYNNSLLKLLTPFKIGLSALMSKNKLELTNKELERSTALRAQLLRSITHGLNTPLSTIKGYVKLILLKFTRELSKNSELNKYIKKLDLATEDMDEKIKMYLDLARINRNDLKLEYQEISLSEFIKPVFEQLLNEAKPRDINLNDSLENLDGKKITIDPARFVFAVKNVFLNALKFAPANDKVKFNVVQKDDTFCMTFEDHGKQINKKYIPFIGQEFLPPALMKERIHYGDSLAVALAVKIIRLAGGELNVVSNKDKTTHTITLPLKPNELNV